MALPSPVGGLGLAPRKKIALKICNSEQVLVLLSYITAESWGIIPSPESGGGDLSPSPPCSDAYAHEAMTQGEGSNLFGGSLRTV